MKGKNDRKMSAGPNSAILRFCASNASYEQAIVENAKGWALIAQPEKGGMLDLVAARATMKVLKEAAGSKWP